MKISVKTDGKKFFLMFPTSLACNGLVAKIVAKHTDGLSAEQLSKLFKALKQYRRRHGPLDLVDVATADGTKVHITI